MHDVLCLVFQMPYKLSDSYLHGGQVRNQRRSLPAHPVSTVRQLDK